MGVSKERMKLSMNAITQMMNKGKVSSEELRLQLSESLPGKIVINQSVITTAPLYSNVYRKTYLIAGNPLSLIVLTLYGNITKGCE